MLGSDSSIQPGLSIALLQLDYAPHLNVINSDCEYVLRFKLSKPLFRIDENVLFGAVFIPLDNSKYFRSDLHNLF